MRGDDALVGQCSFLPLFFFFRLFLSSRSALWLPSSPLFLPLFSRFFIVSSVFFMVCVVLVGSIVYCEGEQKILC